MGLMTALPASVFKSLKPGDKFWVRWYETGDIPDPENLNEIQTVQEVLDDALVSKGSSGTCRWSFSKLRADADNVLDTGRGLAYFFAVPENTVSMHCSAHNDDEDRPHIVVFLDIEGAKTRCLECGRITWR